MISNTREVAHERFGQSHATAARTLLLLACLVSAAAVTYAQPQQSQPSIATDDPSPPPVRYIPEDLRQQLSLAKDASARNKLSLQLAEESLHRAATHTASERYEAAGRELGVYQAIIEDAVRNVKENVRKDGKRRDLFKRMELTLRAHMPRIETLRRITPSEEAVHVKACMEFVREARVEALNSFYDDTVIRMPKESESAGSTTDGKGSSPDASKKKPEQR
ncbi:MAG TPA: hypothetical protein VGV59_11295 [Pyrinomonadaceae bacterium]|nr:hypothetical protein [Pyrinomonadaceae bacterium]